MYTYLYFLIQTTPMTQATTMRTTDTDTTHTNHRAGKNNFKSIIEGEKISRYIQNLLNHPNLYIENLCMNTFIVKCVICCISIAIYNQLQTVSRNFCFESSL